jgi:hypothetical protein
MKNQSVGNFFAKSGCLLIVLAPLAAAVLYPHANWLFAVPVVLICGFILLSLCSKGPSPSDFAAMAERILDNPLDRDVDEYECLRPRDERVEWLRTLTYSVGGAPENWSALDEGKKDEIRDVIRRMRELEKSAQ